MINISGIVVIWLMVNLIMAAFIDFEKDGEDISGSVLITGIIVGAIAGHILIMVITKILHALYVKNLENAFKVHDTDFHRHIAVNNTEKTDMMADLKNEYLAKQEQMIMDTEMSRNDESGMNTHRGQNTERNLASREDENDNTLQNTKNHRVKLQRKSTATDLHIGDDSTIKIENTKGNNFLNASVFALLLLLVVFLVFFCCIFTYNYYTGPIIGICLLMILIATILELLILRPLTCFILSLHILCCRKARSKEMLIREIEEVKEELGLDKHSLEEGRRPRTGHTGDNNDLENNLRSEIRDHPASANGSRLDENNISMPNFVGKFGADKKKRDSRSEAAKIAKLNIQL